MCFDSLLRDKKYTDQVKNVILTVKQQRGFVDDYEDISNISNENRKLKNNNQLFFEMLLEIRWKNYILRIFKKKIEREKEQMLLRKISALEKI